MKILNLTKVKPPKGIQKIKNRKIDNKKKDEDINHNDINTLVKANNSKSSKVYEINLEKKTLLKERREKTIQNAKERQIEKANSQAALQAHTRTG